MSMTIKCFIELVDVAKLNPEAMGRYLTTSTSNFSASSNHEILSGCLAEA